MQQSNKKLFLYGVNLNYMPTAVMYQEISSVCFQIYGNIRCLSHDLQYTTSQDWGNVGLVCAWG